MAASSDGVHVGRVNSPAATIEVLPVRTPTLPPATQTNTFLIGTGEAVLIEPATPYEDELDAMVDWVGAARARGVEPIAIVATHHHPDHIGGARALKARLGLPLWGHAMTAQRLEGWVEFDRLLEDGERIDLEGPTKTSLTAMHTPGHAPGHLCFTDEASQIMIAGDMVASIGTIIVEPTDGDMILYLDSLRRMAADEPAGLLPAHGGLIEDPQSILAFYVAHRLMREEKVFAALQKHGAPARPTDIVADAYADTPEALWPLALRSIEAHLIKLERDGRADAVGDRWRASND